MIKLHSSQANPTPGDPAGSRNASRIAPSKDSITQLTLEDVSHGMERGLRTLWALKDPEARFLSAGARVAWPAIIRDFADLVAQAESPDDDRRRPARFEPSRRDLDLVHDRLSWFNALSLPANRRAQQIRAGRLPLSAEQRVIWLRAKQLSFRDIGKVLGGLSDETARRRYSDAVHIAWRHACQAAAVAAAAAAARRRGA
jgi:hypothetical protein